MTTKTCSCGQVMVRSGSNGYLVCTHCDYPGLHKSATCERCRRIAIKNFP